MAENLGGISEDVSALIRAINAALPQSNTKKTVDIKVNGAKELKEAADSVKTFGAAVKTLDESGVDRVTKSVGSIMGLLSGKLRNAPVSSITTSLIDVFTKPDASAKELLDTVLEVQSELENVQRLSKKIDVSLLTSSQLNSLLSRQSKIDEIRYEFSSDKKSRKSELRREAYQKYEDIDVYKMARGSKSGKKQTAKEIAANIGINPDDVTSADAEQLQTYIRTLDLLKQLIDARKEYGEIHSSADANNYLKQEQQISKVYQEVLKQESAIRDKFKVKGDPLSSAFELDQQTVKANAQQAAEAYVNWFMRTLQTQLNNAIADLDTRVTELQGNIEKRTEQSAQRVEKNTKFARGRRNGGSGSGSGGTGEGTGDGTGGTGSGGGETGGQVPAVTPKTDGVDAAKQQIEKYILTIDECIDKINELNKKKFDFDPDSDEYLDIVDQQALYFARIQKLNSEAKKKISDKELSDRIGGDDYDEIKYQAEMIAKGAADKDVKQQYDALLAYVDSNPVTVKVETGEAKKKTDEIKKTINDLAEQAKDIEFGAVFDSRTGKSSKTYSGKDKQIDLAEAYADAKKSGIQADTYFHTHPDAAKYAAFSLKDIETSIAAVKDGIRQSVLMVGDEVATMDVGSLAGLGQDFLDKFYSAISAHVTDGLNQLRENIAQNLSYGDVIDNLPLITKQLQDELKEALSSYNLTSRDVDIIQPVINAGIDQVSQKLLELVKSGEKLQGRTLINDQIQSIIDNILNSVKSSIVSSGIKIDPNILGDIMSDTFGSLDAVFDQDKFKKMFAKENLPIDKMALIQQKAISDALLQLGKEPEDFYKILTKDQYLGQVYDGENPKSKLHIDVSEAVNEINALKEVVASLKEQIQQLSETKVVADVDELQARLERAQEEIDELNHALAGTVSESSNNFLSEQLSEAEQHIRELGEEVASLRQQLTDVQQKAQQAPLDMGALDRKVAELQYLHDKVRTIFDGKDGIINEDMTYDEKFNSAEVQRMIELLSQLSDAELKATMGIEGDEWVAEFRNNLQTEINLIRELQKEQQKVYDGTWPEDMEEPDLDIQRHLENIYDIVNNVTRQFESKLTPSVREFMSLLEGQVGADGMFSFLNGQNIDRYINDILSGAKTAKEAFADLENAFGWDTDRFASLIDGEVPEELKGLYDQLFSDVENRIKTAEQAADEFNSKLREMQAQAQEVTNPSSDGATLPAQTGEQNEQLEKQKSLYDQIYERIEKIRMLGAVGGAKADVANNIGRESSNADAYLMQMEGIKSLTPSGTMNPDIRDMVLNPDIPIEQIVNKLISAAETYKTCKQALDEIFRDAGIVGGGIFNQAYQNLDLFSFNEDEMLNVVANVRKQIALIKKEAKDAEIKPSESTSETNAQIETITESETQAGEAGKQMGEQIAEGANTASEAVGELNDKLEETKSISEGQSPISSGTVQEQFQKISESTVNVVSDIGKTEDEIIAKLEEERAQAEAANEAWREHLILLDSSGKVVANHWGGEHKVSGFSKEQLESGQGGKIIHTHPGNASFFGAGDLKHLFEESLYSQVKEIELRYSDSILSVDTSSISKESSTTILEIMRNLRSKLTEMYTDNPGGVPSDDIRYQINAIEKEIFKSIAEKLGISVKETGQTSQDVVSALSDIDKQIIERFKSLSIEELKNIDYGKLLSNQTPPSSETAASPEKQKEAGDAAATSAENMKNQAAAVREAEENYNRLNNAVQQYIENQNKVNTGNYKIVHTNNPKDRGRISDMVNYTDIRKGRTTKASIKKILDEYITNKKELDTGYLRGITDEESFKLSDDDLRFRASNADRILDKLSAYVYSYQNMEEAAKLFGNANSEVFDEVQRRIENAKIANEAFEASFTKSDNVRDALSKYGIDKMTLGQLNQLESAMETGGFEAFAAKVKELFGVEIPSSIEEAREAINNLNAESQSLDPSQDGGTFSQKRGQENETEVQSVEQLIAEYERLGSVLSTIEARHKGNIPIGEEKRWDEASKAQKEVADKLRESGMYYSPDQGQWVEDIVNLEDKYKELLSLIESGDTKAISKMFSIDESELGDLEVLKENLKMVIDTLNAADGMSASGAKLSWWDGWLGGGRDLFNTDELTGALKTLGISDDIIEQVAQAHRDAAEAAKQHAAEEQAAADATKNVVDAAGAQKVPGKEQPSINPENTGEAADMSALGDAVNAVTKAVNDKTMAFSREAQTVQESVQMEIASLQRLIEQLEAIRDLGQNLPKIQLSGKDGTKANPIISPELIKSIEQLKTAVGDFDPQKLTELFVSIKNLKINDNISTRMTELATGFLDLKEALDGWEGNAAKTLEMITQLSQKASALKDVIKTANDQNVKKPKDQKSASEKNEPAKPAEKSKDEIRADQLKAYNAALKEFQALENARVRTGQSVDKLGAETLSKRVQLTNQLDSIQKAWNDDAAKGVAKTKEMLDLEQQRNINAEQIAAAESKGWDEQVKKNIGFSGLQNRVAKLKEEVDIRPEAFGDRYKEIEEKAKELSLLFPLKPFDENDAQNAKEMADYLGKMITETRNAPEYKLAKENFVSGLGRKMETWAANNGRAVAANKGAWEKIQEEFKQIDTLADGQNVSKMFDEFVAGANRAGQAGETFTQGLMKRFKSLGQYLLSFASFYRVIGVFKQVYGTVKELDDALVEMRKVSDESLSSLQRYQSLSFNMADEVGTTAQQIQQSTADWLRLGESFEEAQKSAKESTILLNVSEFENIDKATEALVSASQAYKDLDKIDIIDKLNNIGNNFSISTDQLATGLQNAAAVLMTQGNDIDEALALLTAGKALPENTEMYLLEYI